QPADALGVEAAPVDATPLNATPLNATPLNAAPLDGTPLDAAQALAANTEVKPQRRRPVTTDHAVLPKRVRQANLAPELRDGPPIDDDVDDAPAVRSPEQIRAMMAAFQAGMDR